MTRARLSINPGLKLTPMITLKSSNLKASNWSTSISPRVIESLLKKMKSLRVEIRGW